MLQGYKTYIGLAVALLGVLGAPKYFSDGEVEKVVTLIVEVGGILLAAYGRYKATHK